MHNDQWGWGGWGWSISMKILAQTSACSINQFDRTALQTCWAFDNNYVEDIIDGDGEDNTTVTIILIKNKCLILTYQNTITV